MSYNIFTNKQLAKEIKKLRNCIEPLANQQLKDLLVEVERRLNGGEPKKVSSINSKKPQQGKRITKKDAYLKYLYK